MKNLAGNKECDIFIKEELFLAGIPMKTTESDDIHHEVPYTIYGQIGNWIFTRAWYYWMASVKDEIDGLPLDIALELHHRKNPINDSNLGSSIRVGGHCGCPSPDEYGAQPIYDEKFYDQLKALGYKEEYSEFLKKSYVPISYGEVSKLCNEGKLVVERFVDSYHIDDQIGLLELAKTLKKYYADYYNHEIKMTLI